MLDKKNLTLLIVDDDDDLRDLIASIFSIEGFKTLTANSGSSAIQSIKANKVDLVITDMRMPKGDGLYLIEHIRNRDPKFPIVIVVTGYSDISENEFLEKGAAKVFAKPFDRKLLIAAVNQALGLQPAG